MSLAGERRRGKGKGGGWPQRGGVATADNHRHPTTPKATTRVALQDWAAGGWLPVAILGNFVSANFELAGYYPRYSGIRVGCAKTRPGVNRCELLVMFYELD